MCIGKLLGTRISVQSSHYIIFEVEKDSRMMTLVAGITVHNQRFLGQKKTKEINCIVPKLNENK